MSIKLLTLNIENDRHLARVHATLVEHRPDVVCLQEVLESDCAYLASSAGYNVKYALNARLPAPSGEERNWGIAMLTRVPARRQIVYYYVDTPDVPVIRAPNDARRALLVTELDHLGQPYRIATTHFTWSALGHISDRQKADFDRLAPLLSQYPDYVLCGDFNAPRGRELFDRFVGELGVTDHLPANVTSTLDSRFHNAGALDLVVDTVFSTGEYRVVDIRVLEGISDHKGVLARVERQSR